MLTPKENLTAKTSTGSIVSHRIPHIFQQISLFKQSNLVFSECKVCSKQIGISIATRCTECGFMCHDKCKVHVGMNCGLTQDMFSSALVVTSPEYGDTKHAFFKTIFPTPSSCFLCSKSIWGIEVDGMSCEHCGISAHTLCLTLSALPSDEMTCYSFKKPKVESINHMTGIENEMIEPNPSEKSPVDRPSNRRTHFGTDTLLRLSRISYQYAEPDLEIDTSGLASLKNLSIQNSPNLSNYLRRIHFFRGHEFVATYLDEKSCCEKCNLLLSSGGLQCYFCRLCSVKVHKKCYLLTKPCSSSAILPYDMQDPLNELDIYRLSIRNMKDEDFSDELINLDESKDLDSASIALYDYHLDESVLGSGQYGIVKKGHYKSNKRFQIAVKIIDKKRFFDPRAKSKRGNTVDDSKMPIILRRELDILKKLDHPGIIRMHHCIDTPNITYVVMDMATDGDLLDYIMTNSKVQEKEAKLLMKQVVEALRYLHSNGVVHRDLKPENILLSRNERGFRAQIADFGFARMIEKVGTLRGATAFALRSIVGTPAYMAPEIVDARIWKYLRADEKAQNGYDSSADLWSLGVIMYVALGGVFPFDAQQPILDQILRGEFFFPDEHFNEVSDEAVDLCCQLLSVDPRRRLDCKGCLNHPWLS